MIDAFRERFQDVLAPIHAIRAAGTYHYGRMVQSSSSATVQIEGREVVNFISNNYLGFSVHPKVIAAAQNAAAKYGTGMCGSPLACGTTELHVKLAERVAGWFGFESAMIFATGYQALLGTIAAMVGPGDVVIVDALSHRSIVDGAKLSGATIRSFAHNRMDDLAELLERSARFDRKLIAVDAVYSMEGDLADLPNLARLAREHNAALLLDEAHSLGVMGDHGRGVMEHFHMPGSADLAAGTFSKFGGSIGGWATGPADVIDYVKHMASSYVFSSSLPPPLCAGILAAFDVFEAEPEWHTALRENVRFFIGALNDAGFNTLGSQTPVVPILIGDPLVTMQLNHLAFQRGIYASPVMAPLVPPRRSLLRLGVMARHKREHLERAVEVLTDVAKEVGVL
jgi:8-amino-7-oxononanoate synthase